MNQVSQAKMAELVKYLRKEKGLTQEQVGQKTGMNRQMVGRLENMEYIPSIRQLEKLADLLGFDIANLFEMREPLVYTAFRSSSMTDEEKAGVERMFEMMLASKQQILLRKAMEDGKL